MRLEPCAVKIASTVLRGRQRSNALPLPDSRRVIGREIARYSGFAAEIEDLRERALARWRGCQDHKGNLELWTTPPLSEARKNKLPRASPKPQSVKPRKCMDRPSSDDEKTRLASERLLELLREHHPEMEIRKPQ